VSEDRIASRYAQALARGEYARVMDAVPPCRRELLGLRTRLKREGVALLGRSPRSVEYRLLHKARALGRPARSPRLSPEEDRLVERHARMLVKGAPSEYRGRRWRVLGRPQDARAGRG